MAGEPNRKRAASGYNRKHDRKKFKRSTNNAIRRKDLGNGLKGILISCTPNHEDRAFREAVILLEKYCTDPQYRIAGAEAEGANGESEAKVVEKAEAEDGALAQTADEEKRADAEGSKDVGAADEKGENGSNGEKRSGEANGNGAVDISKALQEELDDMKKGGNNLFTRVDGGAQGIVFVQISDGLVDREKVVEGVLEEAKRSGSPNSRHCIRIMPIHSTCYAKAEDAAKAAKDVAGKHFPKEAKSYRIAFRHRLNTGVKRDEYINAIAEAVKEVGEWKVDLTTPDVTLVVEVVKTSCCVGVFGKFMQLGKMNLREVACPSVPKQDDGKKTGKQDGKKEQTGERGEEGSKKGTESKEGESEGKDTTAAKTEEKEVSASKAQNS